MTSAARITVQEAASLSSDKRGLVAVSTLRANAAIQSSQLMPLHSKGFRHVTAWSWRVLDVLAANAFRRHKPSR